MKRTNNNKTKDRGAESVSVCLTVCGGKDKLLLFHLKNKVILEGLLKGSEAPSPDTFKTLLKSTKTKGESCHLTV